MTTVVLAGPAGESAHDGGPHPESPARVVAAMKGVHDLHLGSDLVTVDVGPASREDLARVHSLRYLDELEAFSGRGGGALDPDTFVTSDSWDAACRAAGAGLAAVAELERRRDGVGFVAARPPGHHAVRSRGMGFCLLNNVAVTAASLVAGGARVAIVDWDVHHGNGTQEIFWDEPAVLYISTHQSPLYPGTGRPDEIGGARARGKTVNIPLPPGATGDVVSLAFSEVVAPAVDSFVPDWILVSCGFDAHRADPLAELALSSADFAALAATVQQLAPCGGRTVLFLEGGYDLQAVRRSTASTIGALVGDRTFPEDPTFGGPGADAVRAATMLRERALSEVDKECSGGGSLDAPHTGSRGAPTTRLRSDW
jgi:acetoin utilization deacetylase AcuC-like enzyme